MDVKDGLEGGVEEEGDKGKVGKKNRQWDVIKRSWMRDRGRGRERERRGGVEEETQASIEESREKKSINQIKKRS